MWCCWEPAPRTPTWTGSGPAVAIVVDGQPYLVDAGVGVVRRAVAAGIAQTRLRRVFLTHLHSDHTIGLPDLLLSPWVEGRTEPLEVFGPAGTDAMMHTSPRPTR